MPITNIRIHPAIGVARVGNSGEFFIGPETPGTYVSPGSYKDAHCRVKRQAARFRLFGFDGDNFVKELTLGDVEVEKIEWSVHLVNRKGAGLKFKSGLASNPPPDPTLPDPTPAELNPSWRNYTVQDRTQLIIDPGPRTLDGPGQAAGFNTGKFKTLTVPLGEMRTDEKCRLMVLGGFGNSGSVSGQVQGLHWSDNDDWYDDVSDGWVKAKVKLAGVNTPLDAEPAWVIVGPPKYAPAVQPPVTLYDSLLQIAADEFPNDVKPVFTIQQDVKPFYDGVFNLKWLNADANSSHTVLPDAFTPGDGTPQAILSKLKVPAPDPPSGGFTDMPKMWSSTYETNATVTPLQYKMVEDWASGALQDTAPPAPVYAQLDRAALENCIGGNYYPGIEASWGLGDPQEHRYKFKAQRYKGNDLFRLDISSLKPGDVTKQMALPWQADFFDCAKYTGVAWWPSQRPDDVIVEGLGGQPAWLDHGDPNGLVKSMKEMVSNWHKLGFVVPKGGQQVETERHVTCQNIFFVNDRSHFSKGEAEAAGGQPFKNSFYVIAEGFKPSDLGVSSAGDLAAAPAPALTVGGQQPQGMSAEAHEILFEAPGSDVTQRVTFVYQVQFANTNDFGLNVNKTVTVTASKLVAGQTYSTLGHLTLTHEPNPYMNDGPTFWLSTDVRVFNVKSGQPVGTLGTIDAINGDTPQDFEKAADAALAFINKTVGDFNQHAQANHPFDTQLTDDPNKSQLQVASKDINGARVYNFAVARVRYRGTEKAENVRVFFRLFTTAATGLDYDESSTYRRAAAPAKPVALLGLQGNKVVTIPCYREKRKDTTAVSLTEQTDALNVATFDPAGSTNEIHKYFGCWLDLNQPTPRFPRDVGASKDGPWTTGAKSIQELINGLHQCLVAEVYFPDDPITPGQTPAGNDNLSQRNLVFSDSDNPGSPASHTVQHTFEIKATRQAPQVTTVAGVEGSAKIVPPRPDELMFRWGSVPRATNVLLYMPDVDADEVLYLAGQNYEARRLERVDAHTIRCLPGDVTFVPLPPGRSRNIAALLTLELPDDINRRQSFGAVMHQISGRPRSILGAFQFNIAVSDKATLLKPEMHKLSVLRHIARAIPADDQWYQVFLRYLGQIEDRVRALGGDPDKVAAAPDGSGRDKSAERCARLGWLFSALLALFVIAAGWASSGGFLPAVVAALAAAVAAVLWAMKCAPSACRWMTAALLGLVLGAAVLGVLLLLGAVGQWGMNVLALTTLGLGLLVIAGVWTGCYALGKK